VLRSLITERVRPHHLVLALVVYLPCAAVMFGSWGLLSRVARSCGGLPPFDVRGFWTADDAQALVSACGAMGRTEYIHLAVADLGYPAVSCAALLVATALLLRRFGGRAWPWLLPAIVMSLLDYAENAGIWTLLLQWPDVNTTVATAAGIATALKRVAAVIAFSIPSVLAVAALVRWWRARAEVSAEA
jgi:hypothetical protein